MELNSKCSSSKLRVAVVGAGPAGICALYTLQKSGNYDIVGYDRADDVGGEWYKSYELDRLENGFPMHGSTYEGLRLNVSKSAFLPHEDLAFPEQTNHYPSREEVEQHFQDVAAKFNLKQYIRFSTDVLDIKYDKTADKLVFQIRNLKTGEIATELFDDVFLCVGSCRLPKIPSDIELNNFAGTYLHYRDLKDPARFYGKRMLVVGSSYAAMDMVIFFAKNVQGKLAVSYRHALPYFWKSAGDHIDLHPKIASVKANTVTFVDGSSVDVDVIVFATGFDQVHPLRGDLAIDCNKSNHLFPIYKHVVHPNCPRIFFMGKADIFILSQMRIDCEFGIAVMEGRIKLPLREKMLMDIERFRARWEPLILRQHEFDRATFFPPLELDWELATEKAAMAKCAPMPKRVFHLLYESLTGMRDDIFRFRTYKEKQLDVDEEPDDGKYLLAP